MSPVRNVRQCVDDLVRQCVFTDARRAVDVMRRVPFVELLSAVCREPSASGVVQGMARESYVHSNGFLKISFPPVADIDARLRLHIWPGATAISADDAMPDVHNHRWAFTSFVLTGSLRQEVLHNDGRRDGRFVHYRHRQTGPKRGYLMSRLGSAALTLTDRATMPAGAAYHLGRQSLHRVWAPDGYTATMMVEYPTVTATTDVFAITEAKPTDRRLDPPRFSPGEVRVILRELRQRLRSCQ